MHKPYTNPGECLSDSLLAAYLDGQLTDKEAHLAEKHMMFCSMCNDGAEGLALLRKTDFSKELVFTKKTNKGFPGTLYALAALCLCLLGTGFFWLRYFSDASGTVEMRVADNLQKKISTQTINYPKDSVSLAIGQSSGVQEKNTIATKRKDEFLPVKNSTPAGSTESENMSEPAVAVTAMRYETTPMAAVTGADDAGNTSTAESDTKKEYADIAVDKQAQVENASAMKSSRIRMSTPQASAGIPAEGQLNRKERDKKKSDTEHVEQLMRDGKKFFSKGMWNPAYRCMKRAIEKTDDETTKQEASWIAANALLRMGERQKAIPYLMDLSEGKSAYAIPSSDTLKVLLRKE